MDRQAREVVFEDGSRERYDLLIAIPPHRPPLAVRESSFAGPTGWASVDPATLATAQEGVYAIGDATAIPLSDGLLLPKAGVFAHSEAEIIARNIAAQVRGSAKRREFDGSGSCFLETGAGVAMARGNFYASPRNIRFAKPAPWWSLGKLAFERWWLYRWY